MCEFVPTMAFFSVYAVVCARLCGEALLRGEQYDDVDAALCRLPGPGDHVEVPRLGGRHQEPDVQYSV